MTEKKESKIKEITEKLQEGIEKLFESDNYKKYLSVMGKFTNYSFNNSLLIALQRPDASYVAGFRSWETKFERHVKKGSKGIAIMEPVISKKKSQSEDDDDSCIQKDVTIGYRTGYVFAYEDTYGEPLPDIVTILNARVDDYGEYINVLKAISTVPVLFEPINTGSNGFYHLETRDIHINAALPEAQLIKTLIHEMAHSILHDKINGLDQTADRYEREVCAESVAYAVCSYLGINCEEYSFGYIAGWSKGKELHELQSKMEIIRSTANQLITAFEKEVIRRAINEKSEVVLKNGSNYFQIWQNETGFQYDLYDVNGMRKSTGVLMNNNMTLHDAVDRALAALHLETQTWMPYDSNRLAVIIQKHEDETQQNSVDKSITKGMHI